jgi:outer membrane protein OmpA-like peptidoglycan-associated protein
MDRPMIHRRGLMGCLSLAALACAAASAMPADAQQVLAGKGAVTIDLGVLNQLGQPVAGGYAPQGGSYPAYGQPAYGQPYAQGAYAPGYVQTYGGLQFPPQQYPVSSLMVQPPAGSTPYVPSASAPAMTSNAPAMTTNAPAATSSMAASSASSTTTGTPPPAPTPTPVTVPMLPAATDTSGAATNTATTGTTTTDTTSPAATVTNGTDTTGGTATTGAETNTASTGGTSMVPAATPLTTETTGTTSTGATAAATGTADTGIATTGTTATGTTGTESTTAAAPAAAGTTMGTAATGTTSGTQTASVPPGSATTTEGEIRIAFPADSADIPDATKGQLDALAQKLAGDENIRIQLLAYASGTSDQASRARRMALSRALAVRSYLIKQGVRSTRMDVRALGNNVEGSPADRVDIIPKTQ